MVQFQFTKIGLSPFTLDRMEMQDQWFSLVDDIRGCSKAPNIFPNWVFVFFFFFVCLFVCFLWQFGIGLVTGVTKSRLSRCRGGQNSKVYFEHPRTNLFEDPPPTRGGGRSSSTKAAMASPFAQDWSFQMDQYEAYT